MSALAASDRVHLAKLLGMLGSDHLGERDNAARAAYYEKMESFGIYNVDECRGLEELPPLPNGAGQTHFITRNLMPLEQAVKGADPNAVQAQGWQ